MRMRIILDDDGECRVETVGRELEVERDSVEREQMPPWPERDHIAIEGDLADPTTATDQACTSCGARPASATIVRIGCIIAPLWLCRRCVARCADG